MKFNDWILSQLREREWSQADLARSSGLTRGAISKYLIDRIPDESALRKIAHAFKLPPETVFCAAGILPPEDSSQPPHLLEWIKIFRDAEPDKRDEMLKYARYVASKKKQTS